MISQMASEVLSSYRHRRLRASFTEEAVKEKAPLRHDMVREWRLRAGGVAMLEDVCENVRIGMKSSRLSFEPQDEYI